MAKRSKRIDWNEIRQYAATGARARLQEIQAEMAKILAAFPQLGAEPGVPAVQAQGAGPARKGRRARKGMSAAQRKLVSERMKRYWAERAAGSRSEAAQTEPARRGPRKMSAEARQRIAEAQRKRWAAQKAKRGTAQAVDRTTPAKPRQTPLRKNR